MSVENKTYKTLRNVFSACVKYNSGIERVSLGNYVQKFFVIALAGSFIAFAYVSNLFAGNYTIRFHHLSQDDGLSQGTINCIFQDSRGFMWFGTQDGLNRYDGYTVNVYNRNNFDSNTIAEDTNFNIWIDDEFNDN